jgi:hypothetical protein
MLYDVCRLVCVERHITGHAAAHVWAAAGACSCHHNAPPGQWQHLAFSRGIASNRLPSIRKDQKHQPRPLTDAARALGAGPATMNSAVELLVYKINRARPAGQPPLDFHKYAFEL